MGCGFFRQAYKELRVSDSIGFKIERGSTCPTGGKFRTWPCTAITNAMCQKPTNPWANAKMRLLFRQPSLAKRVCQMFAVA